MKRIREAILKCVYDHGDDDDALIEELHQIMEQGGEQAYSVFFNVLTHLDLDPPTAVNCWQAVLAHRRELSRILDRPLNLRTVICDYLCSVDGSLKNPVVVEIHVFESHLKSLKFDSLTRLFTRASFEEAFAREFARARRYDSELSVLFFDLDDFKSVNDMFGHLAGDLVLRDVGKIIKNEIRAEDSAARYGGEEFVVILPQTGKVDALILAERIRKKVEELTLNYDEKQIQPTISGGLASYPIDAQTESDLIKYADRALYRAKEFGKNNVAVYSHNRRRYIRFGFDKHLHIRQIGKDETPQGFSASAKNISTAGILVETEMPLELGVRVEVSIPMGVHQSPLVLIGTVVRVEFFGPRHYDIGMSFLNLNKSVKTEISDYLLRQMDSDAN